MRSKHVLLFAIALGSFAPLARAQESAPAANAADAVTPARDLLPLEYPSPSARASLAVTGTVVFAAWYGAGVGASLLWDDAPGAKELRIPVVGPWLSLRHTGCAKDQPNCSTANVVVRAIATIMGGVGQLGGLAAIGEAIFLPTAAPRPIPPPRGVRAMPFVAGSDGIGLGVAGAF